jgi:hypothetical protein
MVELDVKSPREVVAKVEPAVIDNAPAFKVVAVSIPKLVVARVEFPVIERFAPVIVEDEVSNPNEVVAKVEPAVTFNAEVFTVSASKMVSFVLARVEFADTVNVPVAIVPLVTKREVTVKVFAVMVSSGLTKRKIPPGLVIVLPSTETEPAARVFDQTTGLPDARYCPTAPVPVHIDKAFAELVPMLLLSRVMERPGLVPAPIAKGPVAPIPAKYVPIGCQGTVLAQAIVPAGCIMSVWPIAPVPDTNLS